MAPGRYPISLYCKTADIEAFELTILTREEALLELTL
jgi:hypothetical protein